jgi:hypothetical protein
MAFLKAPVRSREPKAKGGNRTVALLLFTLPGGNYRTSGALAPRHATVGLVGPRSELRDRNRRRFKDKAARSCCGRSTRVINQHRRLSGRAIYQDQ